MIKEQFENDKFPGSYLLPPNLLLVLRLPGSYLISPNTIIVLDKVVISSIPSNPPYLYQYLIDNGYIL